jgi:Protein of unknown function (DUF815)
MSHAELVEEKIDPTLEATPPEEVKKPKRKFNLKVHTTMFKIPNTNDHYPIINNHSPQIAIEKIISVSKYKGYVGVLNAGESGTGKSTWTKWMIHQLHIRKNSVIIKWFHEEEFKNFVEIVNELTKGIDHIIIFDDISFQLEDMKKEDLNMLQKTLTTIRHIVKANVIVIMNIHYSKAIKKFFRSTTQFRYLTSLSNEEINSYEDLFGPYSKWKLWDFSRIWSNMLTKGFCQFEISRWNNQFLTYKMHDPFNVILASELNDLRFCVYPKESCATCDPDFQNKVQLDPQKLIDNLIKSYGRDRVRSGIRNFSFYRKGIECLDPMARALHRTLSDLDRHNDIDWKESVKIVDEQLTKKRPRVYNKKGFQSRVQHDAIESSEVVQVDNQPVQDEEPEIIQDEGITKLDQPEGEEKAGDEEENKPDASLFVDNPLDMDYGFNDYSKTNDDNAPEF